MAALPDDDLRDLVARVRAGDDDAWTVFVEQFAPLLLQAARAVERDADAAADAFVYTCQHLRDRRSVRLAAFDHVTLGQVLLMSGDTAEAQRVAERARAAARTATERETVERLVAATQGKRPN